ncbi:hypothetical protein COY52_11330 [Candidatus Desantisbacteria bacterium CG_4_10_14_0_8_um_filter_48_22]|uniref:DUF1761 domain-containing protein n=1 Tax=Candidatus Desantisbacteria bacterium CG_4_10_14_0_8_um_filter_48_22 TaxID=1974543 RepID=A0A2M7S597_9BACT|nr:MAG: hypothetical protein COS16_10005 [Candidatus Desantisbacteria bacterium CG02_land_8_20_14_3_00_49_13]PIZ14704.1 MAG: hypothetical protein COY52_11330 [Candidatus Desantisbacteria bacterium CG_4_10_14_0_8_um_filter_48_22]PJB28839.1 MAG: hypothetical protein CO111_00535 [Candidatus Desantisbacteria bacterium CG_4_9_14_3_um_filter_50_7]
MTRYIIISIISGILFALMDGFINGNPFAAKLFEIYKPIARSSLNIPAGMIIDLLYGFAMAGIFLLLYNSLPGATGLAKGASYAVLIWFFRVAMQAMGSWMMFRISEGAVVYSMLAGFGEMLALGILYGLTLKPPM